MCAITGSKNLDVLKELVALNSYRGSHSYSFSLYNMYTGHLHVLKKKLGKINLDEYNIPTNCYAIVHIQAPTTDARTENFIHPAVVPNATSEFPFYALWHNGIIKEDVVREFKDTENTSWDTMIMLSMLNKSQTDWKVLNKFDGSFSCLFYDGTRQRLCLFRNQISPMYIDDDMNISSTKFEGCLDTLPDVVYEMDLNDNKLHPTGSFTTVENPYFFME